MSENLNKIIISKEIIITEELSNCGEANVTCNYPKLSNNL